jgi:hypothetical protein
MDFNSTINITNATLISECLASEIRSTLRGVETIFSESTTTYVHVFPYVILVLSIPVSFLGEILTMPAVALTGFMCTFVLSLELMDDLDESVPLEKCDAALVFSFILAAFGALTALCVFRSAFFLLGAVVGAVGAHQIMDSLPEAWEVYGMGALLMGRPLFPYWAVVATCCVVSGVVAYWKKDNLLLIVTSVVGSWGITTGCRGIATLYHSELKYWLVLLIFSSSCILSIAVQIKLRGIRRVPAKTDDASHVVQP